MFSLNDLRLCKGLSWRAYQSLFYGLKSRWKITNFEIKFYIMTFLWGLLGDKCWFMDSIENVAERKKIHLYLTFLVYVDFFSFNESVRDFNIKSEVS